MARAFLRFPFALFGILVVATALSGCFQATNKFYEDSGIITDQRFEGTFEPQRADNDPSIKCSAVVKLEHNDHYAITVRELDDWIKLDAVLFKAGTNLFVDLSQVEDNKKPSPKGDRPSRLEWLRQGTKDKDHVAIRFEFKEHGLEGQIALGAPFVRALRKDPTLKTRAVDDHFAVLLDPTEKLRSFLIKIGNDPSIYVQRAMWIRSNK